MDFLILFSAFFYLSVFVGLLFRWALPLTAEQQEGLDTPS